MFPRPIINPTINANFEIPIGQNCIAKGLLFVTYHDYDGCDPQKGGAVCCEGEGLQVSLHTKPFGILGIKMGI